MSNELPCGALKEQTEHANLHAYAVTPEVLLAAQPQVGDWASLVAQGYTTVLNLRSDPERAAEQARSAGPGRGSTFILTLPRAEAPALHSR